MDTGKNIVAKLDHDFIVLILYWFYMVVLRKAHLCWNRFHNGGLSRFHLGLQLSADRVAVALFVGLRTVNTCDSRSLVGGVYSFHKLALVDGPLHGPQTCESEYRLRFSVEK
jgi:hypothetical protein